MKIQINIDGKNIDAEISEEQLKKFPEGPRREDGGVLFPFKRGDVR